METGCQLILNGFIGDIGDRSMTVSAIRAIALMVVFGTPVAFSGPADHNDPPIYDLGNPGSYDLEPTGNVTIRLDFEPNHRIRITVVNNSGHTVEVPRIYPSYYWLVAELSSGAQRVDLDSAGDPPAVSKESSTRLAPRNGLVAWYRPSRRFWSSAVRFQVILFDSFRKTGKVHIDKGASAWFPVPQTWR